MADGTNVTINVSSFQRYFKKDQNGMIHPISNPVMLDRSAEFLRKMMNSKATDIYSRIQEIQNNVDRKFASRPEGDSPVIGTGYKKFGDRPSKRMLKKAKEAGTKPPSEAEIRDHPDTRDRAKQIRLYAKEVYEFAVSLKDTAITERENLLADVEVWQAKTGGGFDNTKLGDVTRNAVDFVNRAHNSPDLVNSELGMLFTEEAINVGQELASIIGYGKIRPDSFTRVRFEQDTDGLIGASILKQGKKKHDSESSARIKFELGVDTSELVGKTVYDKFTSEYVEARVIDAIATALDSTTVSAETLVNMIIILARIQKHGWKEADEPDWLPIKIGDKYLVPKDGKSRSIKPTGGGAGAISAMMGQSFQRAIQEHGWKRMPSLMKPEDAKRVCFEHQRIARSNGYQVLPLDWSAYDATLPGAFIATAFEYTVKPSVDPAYHAFVDVSSWANCHKTVMLNTNILEELDLKVEAPHVDVKGVTLAYIINALDSGDKWTHSMGSLVNYIFQRVIARLLGYEYPEWAGLAAGDDTSFVLPESLVDLTSAENTYKPIEQIAALAKMEINAMKQIWIVYMGEVTNHFLQLVYHYALNIQGVGSMTRPLAAMYTTEKDKDLIPPDQMMAEVSRASNGYNNEVSVEKGCEFWLNDEQVLLSLYQEHGEATFQFLIDAAGGLDKVLQSASFTGKANIKQYIESKEGPIYEINAIAARVSSRMSPAEVPLADAIALMTEKPGESK